MMIAVCLFSISCSRTHPYQLIRDFHFIADKNFLTDKENGLAVAVRDSDATLSVVPQKKKKRREKIEKQSRDTSFPRSDSTPLQPFFFFRFTLISLASPTLGFTSRFSTRERERESLRAVHVIVIPRVILHRGRDRSIDSAIIFAGGMDGAVARPLRRVPAQLEKRPYAFLANPTTEIIILADILANVRMQFYLLLSWETR